MLYSIVALLVVIFDQAVKFWVTDHLLGFDEVTFIPGLINLVDVPNDGAAFGFLSGGNARIYFIIVTVVFCLAVIIALATNFINGRVARWSLVMVAAGGFSNCIDRVMYGYVVDMFKVVPFNFAIFNVADIFITVFCIVFALAIIFEKDKVDDDDDEDEDDSEDEEEEYEEPKPRRGKRRHKDEDDEEEVEERPARRGKKAKAEAEYEEYKAAQAQRSSRKAAPVEEAPAAKPQTARQAAAPAQTKTQAPTQTAQAPARTQTATRTQNTSRPTLNSTQLDNDPFAEWEQANARVDDKLTASYAARAMDAGVNTSQSRSVYHPVKQTVEQPVQQNPQSVPQPAAAPAAKPKSGSSEYDLDSILNEFK
jgi:signal peptidase II